MSIQVAVQWLSISLVAALCSCSSTSSSSSASGGGGGSGGSSGSGSITVPAPPTGDATYKAVTAAEAFLATLDATQRKAVSFAFDDEAQRTHWSNFPTGIFQRNGVKLGDMTDAQQQAALDLLASLLSAKGYQQAVDTVNADEALKNGSSGGNLVFGRAEYYVSILGTPAATSPWMVQFGGHHLAINATVVGGDIALTPSLTGAQPASYELNGVTIRPQGTELDTAFKLIAALTAEEQQKAIIGDMFTDLALGPGQDGKVLAPEGIRAADLAADQQMILLDLIQERAGILNDEDAALRMADIKEHLADTYFAWSGPIAVGSAAYYRVTGPTLAIEYSPQQLGGSATDHTHAMYRDPTNDYGVALYK